MSHWYDSTPKKSRRKRDSNPGPSALEADALTSRPTRRSHASALTHTQTRVLTHARTVLHQCTPHHTTPLHDTARHYTKLHCVHYSALQNTTLHAPLLLFVDCLTSQQQASVSKGRICYDSFVCRHTETEVADPTFYLTPVTVY